MPPDAARIEDTRAWLQKAAADLLAAEHGAIAQPPLLGDVAFHCQQAVEKTFKALLAWHDQPFRKTHNLEELGEAVLALDGSLKTQVDRAVPLTEYAWKFRYPGELSEPTRAETVTALELAREVCAAIQARLPGL